MVEDTELDRIQPEAGHQQHYAAPTNLGIVYILSNEAMPEYLKIGKTAGDSAQDVQERMRQLDGTGVPLPFFCEYAAVVADYVEVEKALHTAFSSFRVPLPRKREFFKELQPVQAQAFLKLISIKDVTPDVGQSEGDDLFPVPAVQNVRFNFSLVDIPVGAELEWVDDSRIKCIVIDGKTTVEFEEVQYSISGLAKYIKQTSYGLNGTLYWRYQGEKLQDRRERLEREREQSELE